MDVLLYSRCSRQHWPFLPPSCPDGASDSYVRLLTSICCLETLSTFISLLRRILIPKSQNHSRLHHMHMFYPCAQQANSLSPAFRGNSREGAPKEGELTIRARRLFLNCLWR